METEGLETVHTSLGGNAVAPEGGSFLEPPSIAKVPGEEIFRKQIDLVPCLAEKNEKQEQKDEGFDTTEEEETKENAVVDETNQIAEQEQVADVTGTILKMDKIEGPCINIGEVDKTVKHVEAMEDGVAEVEGKPKGIEKEIGGPKKYEEGETNIEESVELETSKEVSSFEPSSSQGKEPLSQTADPTINNLDNPETGEGVQDKRNTEDIATATHETKEKQTEEMYSQQVDKPDVCMVSETESEENVNRSPQGEVQNLILEITDEAGSSEGENIKDEMNPEQNPDGLFVKHEENKQSLHQDLAMADESTEANENNTSDAVPITITTALDHSVIADEDKIMDVVANIVPDHGKEEMSKYEDQIRETFVQKDEVVDENENSMALISREIDTATSTECSEAIASAKEETPIKITGEDFEDKKEEKLIDTDAVVDSGLPIEKGLPPTDLNEKIEDAGIELRYKNSSELHISHSLEQETMPVQGEKKPEDSDFEPQEQDHEANGQSKDLEKHAEDASEASESMQNTDLENPSGEGAITAEVNSKANEMTVEREEKANELESEEKLAIDDAGTNFVEEMQKKEEAHDEQTYEMAASDRIEEVNSDEVCSREFVDEKVERGVQAAGFQEAEIPLKNGVEESYEMSSSVNEEVIDEPKITAAEEVIDEEKIKDEATQLSSELVFKEKIVESSPDKETETEMSKGDDVEEQMMEDNNAKIILRESIQEASVNDCKNEGKNAEKSSREIYEVSNAEKKAETNNNDEIPDSTLQASLLKEQESLQTENLTAEAEEKDEDGSSIRKDEDEENNNGLKEVKECSEEETLKGEEDGEQISPKNEPGENLESSASMVSSGTGDVALNETTQKTEEEIDEGVEGIKKGAEIGKEDGEEQAIDENDDESIQVESIKEVPVSMVPNDENNAEEFEGEIFEESVTAGTNVSITDATCQNDGAPSAVLETSTVKQMEIVQGEDKDTASAEASPEEEEEHDRDGGLKRFEDNSSEIRLEGDPEKSDEETSRTIHAVAHEINQHIELPNSTLETSPVEEQASLKTENLTPAENSPEGKKYEDGSSNKKDEDKEKNTGIAEENVEQILQNNTLVENPKQPINICAETEADNSSKMVDNREEIVEIPGGNAEAELLKEENIEGHVVEESNINSLSRESAEESPIKDFQNAAKNYEKSTEEMLESQIARGDETHTNDEDCNSSLTVSVDKIDESFKGEDENITPVEASPHDEKEERGSFDRAEDGNDNNPELIVTNQDSSRVASEVQDDSEKELTRIEPGELEEPSTIMDFETEANTLSDKNDDITSQEEAVTIQNIEETVEKEKEEEHGSSDKEGEGNDSNPDLTMANQDSVREASEVQGDSEQEWPRIEPGEPEESSTIMTSETKADTLSDKIDDSTSQEEAVTIQNIEETVEKEKDEGHGSSDKEDEGNDSNPDLTVANQESVREASEVQDDSEQELPRIEQGEPEELSTIMASETEADTLSDKIDDITSQEEEVVTIHNIEETMEKEKEEEHGSLDKEGEGNDSNPDVTVANQESVREVEEVQGDSEQELLRIEPGEPEEPSTIIASETEADTLSDKINDITRQEEAVTIHNIEETVEKEKKEGSEDVDVTKVERAVMEEDLKLVAEASDANKSVENDVEENIISGGKEVEIAEKTFELDSIQKLEVEEKREHKVEETMDEDIKEVCGDTKLASLSVDTEKHVTTEEHTNTDISPHTTGETTTEEKAETVNEMEESVIASVDKDDEKKVTEEKSAINDQSRIIYKGDESGMLVEHEVHEIIKDNNEVPLSSTNEGNPLHKETEDESDEVKPDNEVKDSKSEFTEPFEARGLGDRQEFETLRGKQGPSSDIYLEKAPEEVSEKESNKSLIEISCLESESKGEILEEVQPDINDSRSTLITGITGETSLKEAEPEDKRQIESFKPAPQEKGPVTESTERTTRGSMDIDAKPEDANFIEKEDHGIPAASEAEELENKMHKETPLTGSEEYEEETTNETPLGGVLDDKQEECSAMLPEKHELKTNEGNNAADENPATYENIETPQTPPQEIEIMLKEDMPINERDASKSVDPRKESIKEEDGSYQLDNLNEHHELDNKKQEGIDISKSSEVRGLTNQGEICKMMSLEDEYSSNVGDEALKCVEATSAERKEVILEEDSPTKKPEDSLTKNVEANKAAFELEERTNNQEQAIGTEDYGVLPEENFEVSGKKLKGTETGDQSSQNIPEAYSGTVENSTEIQNKSLKSIEQSSQESQEVREETGEKTELRFETEGDVKETQNTDETVKDVLLTEEVHEKVDEASGETLKSTEKDVNDTLELCAKSTEDERVHEVKESSLIAGECHDATESNEQTTIMSSDFQEAPTMQEMSLAKAINDEDNEMPAVLSTTTPAEELDEMIKVIKEEDNCRDKIKATVEITETSLEEAQLDEKPVQVSNINSNDSVSLEIEAEACQEEKVNDNIGLELPSLNLASQIPIHDHKNIMREQVAKENADADDVQENEEASGVVYESKDHGIEELITSKIKEENEKSSEIGESPGAEAAANEAVIDQNLPEVISKDEQGISAKTERREENMKDVEFREGDLRKAEDVSLQKDDDREERDISQLELQPNKDIQNQSPKEVLEEECGTPGETKEEIKEDPKLVSMTNSQGFEALQEDESTSGHTVPEEKSEEQNQTPAVALLSKEKDCGTEMIIENIEEYVHVELPADPRNYSPPKITEDTCLHEDSLNEVQVEESKSPDDASKLQIPEYETSKETFESMPEVHGLEGFSALEETEIKEKHLVVATTDLEEENRGEKLIDSAEIMHDGVIEEGTFEGTSNLRTELSEEAVKSVSEVHGHEVLAESEDTEIKVKHPEVTATDMAAEENQTERTIDATEIIHDKLKSEEVTKRETQQIMEEREDAKNGDPVDLGEETTKECQEEYELKAEESIGDKGTQNDIQNEEFYKEVEKADENERIEKQMDTERIIEHLHLAAAENKTVKESFLDEAGSEMHLGNQICGTASGNDGRTETTNVKEEEMDVEISQKEAPTDLVEDSEATRDIHEEEETSKTTTEHIEEHVKEVEIEVDEHPSATKTTENTCWQKEETKEQEVCGSGVECNIDMQKNGSNEFDKEAGRTTDEDSTMEPQGYENKIKDKEHLPESNKMTEIAETGAFEKTSDLRAETSEETSKSVSEVHEHEALAESEHAEIKKEKHTEVAVTDLVAGENQNKKTIDATKVVHDELTNEELAKQEKQQFKEEKEDTENCKPINLGEETTKESHQIYDLKAEKSHEDKMENEIQNEEEFGAEISEKESLQDPAEANETKQDIHQGERDSDSTSEKPVPVEAETQETTERKKDAPQGLLQEPIVESTQGAEVGESEPGKATGIVDAQGFEPRAEIDEKNVRGNDESMSANISLFDMMQNSTRELQVKGDLTEEKESNEETRFEGEKTKSDEEKEDEEEGEEHKTTDSPVMVEASRDTVDVKVASKKHHNILSGVGSKVKQSISKVKKAITGKSSHPKQHSPK